MKTSLRMPEMAEDARLSDTVYEVLLDAILCARLTPGTTVSELALARELDVSRTPVHDALRQLAKDGLIRQKANHRAVVASFSADDLYDIFEMRKLLEGESAARAAERLDPSELQRLCNGAEQLADQKRGPAWVRRWADLDEDFHATIARASGSKRLCDDILRYRTLHRSINRLATNADVLQEALSEHRRILDALEHHDVRQARETMIVHIAHWQGYFCDQFAKQESPASVHNKSACSL
jgi:DNA-binding GntR family transcriptional regulator